MASSSRALTFWLWLVAAILALGAVAALALMYMLSYDCPTSSPVGTDIGCIPMSFWHTDVPVGSAALPLGPTFFLLALGSGLASFGAIRVRRRK